jgi:hypothetical protein
VTVTDTALFTDIEAATLVGLYPQWDQWWAFWYALSDEVEDRGDDGAADFMRWLYRFQQRPAVNVGGLVIQGHPIDAADRCQWWTIAEERILRRWQTLDPLRNYLPSAFAPVCRGYVAESIAAERRRYETHHWSLVGCLTRAADLWKTFTPDLRATLWKEWAEQQ